MAHHVTPEHFFEMSERHPYVGSRLVRGWIRFWYHVSTRFLVVMVPTYLVLVIPLLQLIGIPAEYMGKALSVIYLLVFCWAVADNDFETRWRAGSTACAKKVDFSNLAERAFARCEVPAQAALQRVADVHEDEGMQHSLDLKFGKGKVTLLPELDGATAGVVRKAILGRVKAES